MAYTTIDKSDDYFNTVLYTGNGSTQSVTGVNFQPDWSWLKCRSIAYNHRLYDSVRGALKNLQSNSTSAEATADNGLSAFNSDGFTVTQGGDAYNQSGETYVSWNWLAANGTASNSNGSITSTVSANTTSGFSIVSYTGTAVSGATVGHGLNAPLGMVIAKNRDDAQDWRVYHKSLGTNQYINLNNTNAVGTSSAVWQTASFTNDVFAIGDNDSIGASGNDIIAYCFAEKKGFSKFGSYIGNSSADGIFVYTGFKPAFLLVKNTQNSDALWYLFDNKRNSFNLVNTALYPNSTAVEGISGISIMDFVSNGFKLRGTSGGTNPSGQTMIYMAFAENPFVTSTGIPACAR